jgi:hypothetical protein
LRTSPKSMTRPLPTRSTEKVTLSDEADWGV